MEKVFISFSSKDSGIIKKITEEFHKNDVAYWICKENDDYGAMYAASIVQAIKECDIFLTFLSQNSNISQHVANEINIALMNNKVIIPVILDEVQFSPAMEYYLSGYQWIDFRQANPISRLILRIREIRGQADGWDRQTPDGASASVLERAMAGDAEAQFQMGKLYYYGGPGVGKDFMEAVYWYTKAAKAGNANAACNLGWCYETGSGIEQSWPKAFEWYTRSADLRNKVAKYSLGWMFEHGISVPKNGRTAFQYYFAAAELGHDISQYKVGLAYQNGTHVDQDYQKANQWFQRAAENSFVAAQYMLAENCYWGRGMEPDIIKAKNMWILSAEMGYMKSCEALERYYDIFYNAEKKSFDV